MVRNLLLRGIIHFAAKLKRNGKDTLLPASASWLQLHGHKMSQHVCRGTCAATTTLSASIDPPFLPLPAQARETVV